MKRIIFLILLLAGLSSCVLPASASNFKDQGKPIDIQVEVGKVTEVVFPAKVAKVVKGGAVDSVLVEVLDNSVYMLPKTDDPSDIFVMTTSGNSYPLNLHISREHDIKVQIGSFNHQPKFSAGVYGDVMDLMKDLLLQKEPAGATALPGGNQVLLANRQIQLKVDKAYELAGWKAYVLTARNLMNNAVIIPIEQMTLPNLLAVSSDQDMLAAKGQQGDAAKVYVIMSK
ncbi:MAG: type-F conjugative transfer system secretin TraK [Candidatus Omnitrophica bacterium]|nr:type-F conjugative transfer system secretin TraK [Candidatus Omnitrophota bacterium]